MDLTQRQQQIADAALAIVAREGMAAVSFRTVAAEAGWSLGAVQKAYASKADLERAMLERLRTDPGRMPATEPGRPTLADWLTDLFCLIVPLDEESRRATLLGSAFADRAAHDAAIGQVIAEGDGALLAAIAGLVRRAGAEGEIAPGLDADTIAWAYLALAQGCATQLLYTAADPVTVRARAGATIAALLGQGSATTSTCNRERRGCAYHERRFTVA